MRVHKSRSFKSQSDINTYRYTNDFFLLRFYFWFYIFCSSSIAFWFLVVHWCLLLTSCCWCVRLMVYSLFSISFSLYAIRFEWKVRDEKRRFFSVFMFNECTSCVFGNAIWSLIAYILSNTYFILDFLWCVVCYLVGGFFFLFILTLNCWIECVDLLRLFIT